MEIQWSRQSRSDERCREAAISVYTRGAQLHITRIYFHPFVKSIINVHKSHYIELLFNLCIYKYTYVIQIVKHLYNEMKDMKSFIHNLT